MSRPLPNLVLFLALSFVLVAFVTDTPLPLSSDERTNVTIGSNQTEIQGDVADEERSFFDRLVAGAVCVGTLGLTEIVTDVCQIGFGGIVDTLSNVTVIRVATEGMGTFVALLGALMTFNVPEAPGWVRFLVGTPIIGTVGYIVISLVRGAG